MKSREKNCVLIKLQIYTYEFIGDDLGWFGRLCAIARDTWLSVCATNAKTAKHL